jgi:allantoinase
VTNTFLRGTQIYSDGKVTGLPTGQYVKRPATR